jgi:hypothetical protein
MSAILSPTSRPSRPDPLALATTVVDVYYMRLVPNKITSQTSFARSSVESLVAQIPKGLAPDNIPGKEMLKARRFVLARLGYNSKSGVYTDHEANEALFQVCTGKMSHPAAREIYGVPESTNKRKQEDVRIALNYADNKAMRLDKTADGLSRIAARTLIEAQKKRGPEPYLSSEEIMLVGEMQEAVSQSGGAADSRMTAATLRDMVHAKGAEALVHATNDAERKRAAKMMNAKISRAFTEDQFKKAEDALGVDGTADPTIPNLISIPVAIAAASGTKKSRKMKSRWLRRTRRRIRRPKR